MNRSRSNDSLDNRIAGVASSGSSSPSDFSSDDEISPENLFMVGGKVLKNSALTNKDQGKHENFTSRHYHNEYPLQSRQNMILASSYRNVAGGPHHSIVNPNHQNRIHDPLRLADPASVASTSRFNDAERGLDNVAPSAIPDIVPDPEMMALIDDDVTLWCNNDIDTVGPHQMRNQYQRMVSGGAGRGDNAQRFGPGLSQDNNHLFDQTESSMASDAQFEDQLNVQLMVNLNRNSSSMVLRLCNRLVECRSVLEAVRLIERNRDVIDNLTRVVTHDASAYRNYDMSNYQVDHSVKESFNPSFWNDRVPIITTADGNCQYHAVSLSLTGTEDFTQEVRLATAVAVIDHRDWFDAMLKLIDRGTVLDLMHTIARSYSWGDETTLKAIAVAIKKRIFLYTCNIGKKDYELVKSLTKEELLDAFKEKKYRGGTGIHTYADPLTHVSPNNYIMLFHKSEHFIAVLPTSQQPTMFEPYNPIVPVFT